MGLGAPELLIVLIIVLVVFGGAKLPKLARSLGEAQREFKKSSDTGETETVRPAVPPTTTEAEPKGPVS